MARTILTDQQWDRICGLLPGKPGDVGRPPAQDNRTTLEGILWVIRTGAPWRDMPDEFGKWNTVYVRFRRWIKSGVFAVLFKLLASELNLDTVMVDGTFVKVHQHGAGAPKGDAPAAIPVPPKP